MSFPACPSARALSNLLGGPAMWSEFLSAAALPDVRKFGRQGSLRP